MKKLLIALVLTLTSGCTLIDAYLMTKYDPNEYKLITDIRAKSQIYKTQCEDQIQSKINATKINNTTTLLVLYSEHIPRNVEVYNSAKEIDGMAKGIESLYAKNDKVSPVFCKIKYETMEKSADKVQTIIGKKPR